MSTMTVFYKNYVRLCAEKGVSASAAAESVGLSRTSPNGWKSGKKPSDTTLAKLAAYFGVSIDDLVLEQKEKPAIETGDGLDTETRELLDFVMNATQNDKTVLLSVIRGLKSRNSQE